MRKLKELKNVTLHEVSLVYIPDGIPPDWAPFLCGVHPIKEVACEIWNKKPLFDRAYFRLKYMFGMPKDPITLWKNIYDTLERHIINKSAAFCEQPNSLNLGFLKDADKALRLHAKDRPQ